MTEVTRSCCWHQNFVPWVCLPLISSYILLLNHEKMCIKSEIEEIFLNLQQMTIVIRPSCWYQNFGQKGLSAPTLVLCLDFFSSITADFNISSALRWAIQDQWSSGISSKLIWYTVFYFVWSYDMSLVTRKPVFGVCDQVKHKPGCWASDAN